MMDFVEIEVCGVKRSFPVVNLGPRVRVASVSLLGDVELVGVAAAELTKRASKWNPEVYVGPETKVVPLLQKMSEIAGLPRYVVCRKGIQAYMIRPLVVQLKEGRGGRVKAMAVDGRDGDFLREKRVVVVDDVVYTGGSFRAVRQLLEKVGAKYCGLVAVFKQGNRFEPTYEHLAELPVFEG